MLKEVKKLVGVKKNVTNEYFEKLVGMQNEFLKAIKADNDKYDLRLLGFKVNHALFGAILIGYILGLFYGFFLIFYKEIN